jgi:hypothetical protein
MHSVRIRWGGRHGGGYLHLTLERTSYYSLEHTLQYVQVLVHQIKATVGAPVENRTGIGTSPGILQLTDNNNNEQISPWRNQFLKIRHVFVPLQIPSEIQ